MSGSSQTPAWSVVLSQRDKEGFAFVHESINSEAQLITLLEAAGQSQTSVVRGLPNRVPPESVVSAAVYADTSNMQSVLEHQVDDQVLRVETGISVTALNEYLAQHRQWWPVSAPDNWTVADVLDYGAGGALSHRYGGPRELVLGMRVILADGKGINCGGRVVKNVTGYDLGKLFIGSHGWLGIPISAFLRLYALPTASRTLLWRFSSISGVCAAAGALVRSGLPLSALEITTATCFNELPASVVPADIGDEYLLLSQVHGSSAVVDDVTAAAQKCVSLSESAILCAPVHEFDTQSERELWRHFSNRFGAVSQSMAESVLPFGSFKEMVNSPSFPSSVGGKLPIWAYRPATGHFVFGGESQSFERQTCSSVLSGSAVGTAICAFSEQHRLPVTIATVDAKHNFHLHRLPVIDAGFMELQSALKAEFDPGHILNPFVHL